MTTITELSEILQHLLIEDANQIGRESGFIQRQRKLSDAFSTGHLFQERVVGKLQRN